MTLSRKMFDKRDIVCSHEFKQLEKLVILAHDWVSNFRSCSGLIKYVPQLKELTIDFSSDDDLLALVNKFTGITDLTISVRDNATSWEPQNGVASPVVLKSSFDHIFQNVTNSRLSFYAHQFPDVDQLMKILYSTLAAKQKEFDICLNIRLLTRTICTWTRNVFLLVLIFIATWKKRRLKYHHISKAAVILGGSDVPPTFDVRSEMAKLLYISNNILNKIKFDYSHCQSPTLTRLDYGFDGGISSIKKLEKISFTNCNFDYSGLKPPIYHHNCVKRLEFQNCKLSEEFLALLSNSYPLLHSINFHDRWQTFYGSRGSKIYLPNTHVGSINLVEEIDDDGRRKSLNRKHNEMLLTVECG